MIHSELSLLPVYIFVQTSGCMFIRIGFYHISFKKYLGIDTAGAYYRLKSK